MKPHWLAEKEGNKMRKTGYARIAMFFGFIGLLVATVGCGGREPASTLQPSVSEAKSGEASKSITITGIVQDVMLSARVIALQEPVEGFQDVALLPSTRLISSEGKGISLREIKPGMRIQATGHPGSSGALLAEKVQVLP